MYTITSLEIAGYREQRVPNTFFRQDGQTDHLAIVLPGLGYTGDMPVLYYPKAVLLGLGADVLQVKYAYNERPDFQRLSDAERNQRLSADVAAACDVGLAQRAYQRVSLVGKSLGTRAMADLLGINDRLAHAYCVWLTPLLRDNTLRTAIQQRKPRSLFVIGTADPFYDPAYLAEMQRATGGDALVLEGADHSLEIAGDIDRSLVAMRDLVSAVRAFYAAIYG
jgi:hypothetical protein